MTLCQWHTFTAIARILYILLPLLLLPPLLIALAVLHTNTLQNKSALFATQVSLVSRCKKCSTQLSLFNLFLWIKWFHTGIVPQSNRKKTLNHFESLRLSQPCVFNFWSLLLRIKHEEFDDVKKGFPPSFLFLCLPISLNGHFNITKFAFSLFCCC